MPTNIEWTDETWNPIAGCNDKSEGCRNCYARSMARRLELMGQEKYKGLTVLRGSHVVWTGKIAFDDKALLAPLSWKKPRRVFVNSMSDLFHHNVSDEQIDSIFAVMVLCPQHMFQVLTKRPERMLEYVGRVKREAVITDRWLLQEAGDRIIDNCGSFEDHPWPLANVWLGTSVEDQKAADDRLDYLCELASRGWRTMVSFEPLIGPVDPGEWWLSLGPKTWAIVGGESGPRARPMHPDWARSLRDQCQAAGVPYFLKQWGEWKPIDSPINNPKDVVRGRRQCVKQDGQHCNTVIIDGVPEGSQWMECLGKRAAGALLDGVEHREFPATEKP